MPLAWDEPWKGFTHLEGKWAFLKSLSCHFWSRLWFFNLRAVRIPRGLPEAETYPRLTKLQTGFQIIA